MATDTRERRQLRFGRMSEILNDINQLDSAGSVRATGDWTPAQIVDHVAGLMTRSLDGFDFTAPWFIRILGRFMKSGVLNKPIKSGFKLRGTSTVLVPNTDVTWDEAVAKLRNAVRRAGGDTPMAHPSPIFGALVPEEWEQLHCRHAELHFSFLHAVNGEAG